MEERGFSRKFFSRPVLGWVFGILAFSALLLVFASVRGGGFKAPAFMGNIYSSLGSFWGGGETEIAAVPEREGSVPASSCAFPGTDSASSSPVRINEIAWMGTPENYNAEWIELLNTTDSPTDISFFRILSESGKIEIVLPGNTVLPPRGFLLLSRKLENGKGFSGDIPYTGSLLNSGDSLVLLDSRCVRMDSADASGGWPAGENTAKRTMERVGSGAWRTSALSGGTPRAANSGGAAPLPKKTAPDTEAVVKAKEVAKEITIGYPPVFVNEISAGDDVSASNEYVELWNPYAEPFPLSGWSLKKKSSSGTVSSLASASRLEGKTIPPMGFFVIANEGSSGISAGALWAKSNGLAYSSNTVLLVNPEGTVMQEIPWTEIPKGKSFSRNEDGAFSVSERSPGALNP